MIQSVISTLGPWNWWILALIFMVLEILAPGTFFLWFGISAFVIGTITLAVPESPLWVWQTQLIAFVVLSLLSALVGRRYMARAAEEENGLSLNQRGRQLIGRTALLREPIREGYGRVNIGDTVWRVAGPDLPAGSRVRVVDCQGGTLQVMAAEEDETGPRGGQVSS